MPGFTRTMVLLALLASSSAAAADPNQDKYDALIQWVKDLGGMVKAEIKVNKHGVRGLFATEFVREGENIVSIPAAAIINAGGMSDSFAVPTLTVLKEIKSNCTRFKPYVDVFPTPSEVINSCNMDPRYIPMWKSEYWEKNVKEWQEYLTALHSGALNPDIEMTVQEAVGNTPVNLDDLRYACAVSSTRYVSAARRKRLIMAPIYDMANHERECVHTINPYEDSQALHIIAGKDVQPGDELCYSYGMLRDDYAVAHYGFLPALEDPPRLSLVDHPDFNETDTYSHDAPPSEEPFDGTNEELAAELSRLNAILDKLQATPDTVPRAAGQDYVWDLLKGLETRRINALKYETGRIRKVLRERLGNGEL